MTNDHWHITSEDQKTHLISHIRGLEIKGKGFQVKIGPAKSDYNERTRRLAQQWYRDISDALGMDVADVIATCKLEGLRIQARGSETLKTMLASVLQGKSDQEKIEIIREHDFVFPCLRDGAMNELERKEYLTWMQRYWAHHGVILSSARDKELMEWAGRH